MWSAETITAGIVHGALGECVTCRGTCWTWWSPAPPSGYVALHPGCVKRLRDLWYQALDAEGADAEPEAPPLAVDGPRGAYARRRRTATAATVRPATSSVALAARLGIELPPDFVPGPFWKPGYTTAEPWVTLAQTGAGHVFAPFGPNRMAAVDHLTRLRLSPVVMHTVKVVGAAVLAPDGSRVDGWGDEPEHGRPRWETIRRLSEWGACAGCGVARWPGSWVTVRGQRCRGCTEPAELADPRPWPVDPESPGLKYAPHWLGGPKPAKKVKATGEGS